MLLAFFYGQSRIFFVMSRDGLLPRGLSKVSARGTPVAITVFTAVLVAALAGVARLDEIAALANAGTLVAFIAVSVCLLVPVFPLLARHPEEIWRFGRGIGWLCLPCFACFLLLPMPGPRPTLAPDDGLYGWLVGVDAT